MVALPGEGDFVVRVPGGELRMQPGSRFLGEVFGADVEGPADSVERIALTAAVSCWTRRRTSSRMAEPSFTTWNASRTVMASGSSSRIMFA